MGVTAATQVTGTARGSAPGELGAPPALQGRVWRRNLVSARLWELGFWGSKAVGRHTLSQQGPGTGGAPAPAPGCHLCLQQGLGSAGIAAGIAPSTPANPPWICTELPLEQPLELWGLTAPPGWLLVAPGADSGPLCSPCTACEGGGTGSREGQCHQPLLMPREDSTGDLSQTAPAGVNILLGAAQFAGSHSCSPQGCCFCPVGSSGWGQHIQHILQIQQWDGDGDPHRSRAGMSCVPCC